MRTAGLLLALGVAAHADPVGQGEPTPFDRGRIGISLGGGAGYAYGMRYFGIGASAGYYVLDGLAIGLGANYEFGDGPNIFALSPSLTYVAQPLVGQSPVIPYIGTFYAHLFVGAPYEDVDGVGGRTGILVVSGRVVFGIGVGYEHIVSACTMSCDTFFPDVTFSVAL